MCSVIAKGLTTILLIIQLTEAYISTHLTFCLNGYVTICIQGLLAYCLMI